MTNSVHRHSSSTLRIDQRNRNDAIDVSRPSTEEIFSFSTRYEVTYGSNKCSLIQRWIVGGLLKKLSSSKNKIRLRATNRTAQVTYNVFSRSRSIEMLGSTRSNTCRRSSIATGRWFTQFILFKYTNRRNRQRSPFMYQRTNLMMTNHIIEDLFRVLSSNRINMALFEEGLQIGVSIRKATTMSCQSSFSFVLPNCSMNFGWLMDVFLARRTADTVGLLEEENFENGRKRTSITLERISSRLSEMWTVFFVGERGPVFFPANAFCSISGSMPRKIRLTDSDRH